MSTINLKRNLALIAAALLLIGSFLLPNAVAAITDRRRLDNITTIDSQSVVFNSIPSLSLVDRLTLVANPNAELIAWKSGNVMDAESAERKAIQEFSRFLRDSQYEFDFFSCSAAEISAVFIIDTENPAVSMIVWELILTDKRENMATVTVDDETGVIIKIIYREGRSAQNGTGTGNQSIEHIDETLRDSAFGLVKLMAEYYDMEITLADYQIRANGGLSYYRGDLTSGSMILPMFGVVRASGFSMNERVQRSSALGG